MAGKKDVPLALHKALEPIVNDNDPRFQVIVGEGSLFNIIDTDPESEFHFAILEADYDKGKLLIRIEYSPTSDIDLRGISKRIDVSSLKKFFERWRGYLNEYDDTYTIFDDAILRKNQEEFEEILNITDEDANTSPFTIQQVDYLDNFLKNLHLALDSHREVAEDWGVSNDTINDLQSEIKETRKNLTKEPKKKVISRFSRLLAKAKKEAWPILREMLMQVGTEFAKRLILGP